MNINSFLMGFLSALVLVWFVFVIMAIRKHPCTHCGATTKKKCRHIEIPFSTLNPPGTKAYKQLVFMDCNEYEGQHVDLRSVKTVFYTSEKKSKLSLEEFDQKSLAKLCRQAGVSYDEIYKMCHSIEKGVVQEAIFGVTT